MVTYIVLDLEATCDDKTEIQNEIIEIGAVKINAEGQIIDFFNSFVKPILNPVLSEFCKTLTYITQKDIDEAESFPGVLKSFQDWIGEDYVLCSWGFYDRNQFRNDCVLHGLDKKWVQPHISLKHQHAVIRDLYRGVGTNKALKMEGFKFEGTPHRGIDDARNIAKIFLKHMDKWVV